MISAWDCMLTECNMLEICTKTALRYLDWGQWRILRRIRGAEGKKLERALKWYAIIAQVLLRVPLRHAKPGRVNVASRFSAVSEGKWRFC